MIMRKFVSHLVLAAVPLLAGAVWAEEMNAGFENKDGTLFHEQGIVYEIDYAEQTAYISGLDYFFAADARVQINGSFGAWSMLRPNMKVDFLFRDESQEKRTIVELYQLPDDYPISEY
jgi:hypothetical protein